MNKIINSAIKINGKVYEGKHHIDAIRKAKSEGVDVSNVDKENEGLFRVSDGRLITREQALDEFGISHSRELYKDNEKTILCIDSGLYVSLANTLADKGKNKVYYCTPSNSPFPSYKDNASGDNFEFLTKIRNFWDYIDNADIICTFDVGFGDIINYLREKYPDKSVIGAGKGEMLENHREEFKEVLNKIDLPIIPYKTIKGFSALHKYLKDNKTKVVKIDIYRGDFETLICKDYNSIKQILKDREPLFGNYSEDIQFIVEDMVECEVESGFDGFFSDNKYIPFSYGYEVDKNLYVGKVIKKEEDVPSVLMETLNPLRKVLDKLDYRGAISTEERIVSKELHYFIDPCCRAPLPLGVLYSKYIKNWVEFIDSLGRGEPIEIECDYEYVGAYALGTPNARKHFTQIEIEKGKEDDFRFMMACQDKEGSYQAIKGQESVVIVIAAGHSPKEVIEKLKENSEYVNAFNLEKEPIKSIDCIYDVIEKGKKVGIEL